MAEQESLFKNGLDLDSDFRDIEPGFYTYLRNATANSSSSRNKGAAESLKSWTKVTRFWNAVTQGFTDNFQLPIGSNKCVAWCKDIKNNAIIFFNMNSNGYHAIYRYWRSPLGQQPFIEALSLYSPGIPPLNWGNVLNFTKRFQNPFIVETGKVVSDWPEREPEHPVFGNNIPVQLLFWTDGVDLPKRLNTVDLYLRLQEGDLNIDIYWLSVAKIQPQRSPMLSLQQDPTRKSNFLPYQHYQFALRYKYKDGEYTPLSPISELSLLWKPDGFYLNFDRPISGSDNANSIVVLSTAPIHETVDKVEWFVREGNGVGSGNTNPEWYRFSIQDAPANTVIFYGDEETIALSQIEARTNFYPVPQLAAQQEIVMGNQVVYGDVTEGYDPIGVEGTVEEIDEDLGFDKYPEEIIDLVITVISPPFYRSVLSSVSDRQPGDIVFGTYAIGISATPFLNLSEDYYWTYTLTAGDIASLNTFGNNLASFFTTLTGNTVLWNGFDYLYPSYAATNFTLVATANVFMINNPEQAFKEGATHKFAVVHFDEFMRQGATEEIGDLYIPFVQERYPISDSYEYLPKKYGAKINITTPPPIWAKYFKIVHKCNIKKCAFFTLSDISYVNNAIEIVVASYKYFVDGDNPTINGIKFGSKGVVDFEYTEWAGNRLRFLTQTQVNASLLDTDRSIVGSYVDVQILSVRLNNDGFPVVSISDFGWPASKIDVNTLFEVYQPGFEPVYFELPMNEYDSGIQFGEIVNPGTVSRSYGLGTGLNTYSGNIYKRWRSMASDKTLPGQYHIESFSVSDWWRSEFYSKGRIQSETPNMKQQNIFSMLRWSGKLFENTNVNNTNVFFEGDYKILEQKYGSITGLRLIGYTLKVLQWSNISSAFIGRREIQNADGSTQLVVTDSLIGSVNYSEESYGTKNPESVYVNDRSVYFFDVLNRCFVRNSPNGSEDIAKRRAIRFWQDVSDQISGVENCEVVTGWDQENKLLYALIVKDGEFYDAIAWCPDKGFWHGFFDHCFGINPIDNYGDCVGIGVAFYQGNIWIMNDGPTYLNFLGQAKTMKAGAVTNPEPKKVKTFDAHSLRSNRSPLISLQSVPASEINPNGQESEIKGAQYKMREGVYYASTNRNYLRFGAPANETEKRYGLINGDEIRGHACNTLTEFNGDEIVILYSSSMEVIGSERS
jgi:hypothetical protein